MADFTKTYRRITYPTISPAAHPQNQAGRTVLVTGGCDGVGFQIARAFAQAEASKIILVSRSRDKLELAAQRLQKDYLSVELVTKSSDVSKEEFIRELWADLRQDGGHDVDILVLNAGARGTQSFTEVIASFQFNVIANLHMLEHFQAQPNPDQHQRMLLNVSSGAIQTYGGYPRIGYAASKAGFANYLCHLSEIAPESEIRLINYHPGAVISETAKQQAPDSIKLPIWDHPSLSGDMAVWLCGKDADFLHGRFVWANWDADELMAMRGKILAEPGWLRIGVAGCSSFTMAQLMEVCKASPVPEN